MNVMSLFNLEGKVSLVTGGGSGLGKQMAESLAEAGSNIIICSRKAEKCEETIELLRGKGVRAQSYQCDVTDEQAISLMINQITKDFGNINILVNNSGTNWAAPIEEMPLQAWEKVIKVNLTGTFLMSKNIGKLMIDQRKGKIINVASIAGLRADPPEFLDAVGYSTSKAAVIHFTKDLARKWGKYNIHVNAIAPGYFPTKMTAEFLKERMEQILNSTPLHRLGDDHSLKGIVLFLASDASDYVTGQIITVDGGMTL